MIVNKKARTRLIVATGVIVVIFVVAIVYFVTQQGAYYRQVSDLYRQNLNGKNVKVSGRVLGGSIVHDGSGYHFTIQDVTGKADTVKVRYDGQMPETFGPNVEVVVIGKYNAPGTLISADQLQTKCPTKYQAQVKTPAPRSTP
jgi:cytochrome c-type biogenesis protein CcmE